jgi:hypothetical protein
VKERALRIWVFLLGAVFGGIAALIGYAYLSYVPPVFELTSDLEFPDGPGQHQPFRTLRKGSLYTVYFQKGSHVYIRVAAVAHESVLKDKSRLIREGKGHPLIGGL